MYIYISAITISDYENHIAVNNRYLYLNLCSLWAIMGIMRDSSGIIGY